MKKIVIALAVALVVVIAVFAAYSTYYYNTDIVIPEGSKQYFHILSLRGYENNGRYYIVKTDEYFTPELIVEFTSGRRAVRNQGWNLIEDMDIEELLYLNSADYDEKFGDEQFEMTSGVASRSYITDDGYIISARFVLGFAEYVERRDLLTFERIEEYSADYEILNSIIQEYMEKLRANSEVSDSTIEENP